MMGDKREPFRFSDLLVFLQDPCMAVAVSLLFLQGSHRKDQSEGLDCYMLKSLKAWRLINLLMILYRLESHEIFFNSYKNHWDFQMLFFHLSRCPSLAICLPSVRW